MLKLFAAWSKFRFNTMSFHFLRPSKMFCKPDLVSPWKIRQTTWQIRPRQPWPFAEHPTWCLCKPCLAYPSWAIAWNHQLSTIWVAKKSCFGVSTSGLRQKHVCNLYVYIYIYVYVYMPTSVQSLLTRAAFGPGDHHLPWKSEIFGKPPNKWW